MRRKNENEFRLMLSASHFAIAFKLSFKKICKKMMEMRMENNCQRASISDNNNNALVIVSHKHQPSFLPFFSRDAAEFAYICIIKSEICISDKALSSFLRIHHQTKENLNLKSFSTQLFFSLIFIITCLFTFFSFLSSAASKNIN